MTTDENEVWAKVYAALLNGYSVVNASYRTSIPDEIRKNAAYTAANAVEDFRAWQEKSQNKGYG